MIIVNNPTKDFIDVQCYKCKKIFQVHPMHNSNSPFFVDCDLHNPKCAPDETDLVRYRGAQNAGENY